MNKLTFLQITAILLLLIACGNDESPEPAVVEAPEISFPDNLRWQIPLNPDSSFFSSSIPPLIVGDRILYTAQSYSTTIAGEAVHCVDLDGEPLWTWNDYVESLRSNTIVRAAATENTLVVQAGRHYYGIDLADGSTRWHHYSPSAGNGALVAFEDRVYQRFAAYADDDFSGTSIRYFDALTGTLTRAVGQLDPADCSVDYSTPAVERGADGMVRIYYTAYSCASDDTQGFIRHHAYNEDTGQNDFRKLSDLVDSNVLDAPLSSGNRLVKAHRRYLECRDKETGELLWTTPRWIGSLSTVNDFVLVDDLLIRSRGRDAVARQLATGAVAWQRNNMPLGADLTAAAPYAVLSDESLWELDVNSGTSTLRVETYNLKQGFTFFQAGYRYRTAIDASRDRLYVSDGYFLIALDLPL